MAQLWQHRLFPITDNTDDLGTSATDSLYVPKLPRIPLHVGGTDSGGGFLMLTRIETNQRLVEESDASELTHLRTGDTSRRDDTAS